MTTATTSWTIYAEDEDPDAPDWRDEDEDEDLHNPRRDR